MTTERAGAIARFERELASELRRRFEGAAFTSSRGTFSVDTIGQSGTYPDTRYNIRFRSNLTRAAPREYRFLPWHESRKNDGEMPLPPALLANLILGEVEEYFETEEIGPAHGPSEVIEIGGA